MLWALPTVSAVEATQHREEAPGREPPGNAARHPSHTEHGGFGVRQGGCSEECKMHNKAAAEWYCQENLPTNTAIESVLSPVGLPAIVL